MSWNNRIFKHEKDGEEYFGIHETYYDKDGNIEGWTENPISGLYDSVEDLIESHNMITKDIKKYSKDILDYKKE